MNALLSGFATLGVLLLAVGAARLRVWRRDRQRARMMAERDRARGRARLRDGEEGRRWSRFVDGSGVDG